MTVDLWLPYMLMLISVTLTLTLKTFERLIPLGLLSFSLVPPHQPFPFIYYLIHFLIQASQGDI